DPVEVVEIYPPAGSGCVARGLPVGELVLEMLPELACSFVVSGAFAELEQLVKGQRFQLHIPRELDDPVVSCGGTVGLAFLVEKVSVEDAEQHAGAAGGVENFGLIRRHPCFGDTIEGEQ